MNSGGRTPRRSAAICTTTAADARGRPACRATASRATGFASLDLRASRDIKLGAGKDARERSRSALDAFNVPNRVNYGTFVGTLELAAVRPAGFGAGGAPTAVFGADEILKGAAMRYAGGAAVVLWRRPCACTDRTGHITPGRSSRSAAKKAGTIAWSISDDQF